MLSNSHIFLVIYTDHKPFTQFQNSNFHNSIYAKWVAKLYEVNVVLEYIYGSPNTVADGFSQIIFTKKKKSDYL